MPKVHKPKLAGGHSQRLLFLFAADLPIGERRADAAGLDVQTIRLARGESAFDGGAGSKHSGLE